MTEKVDKYILKNGMVILGEPMEEVGSAAFVFRLPAGAATLPEGCGGAGEIITDWILRGAGEMDSRQLIDALDGLGLHRSSSVGSRHIALGAALEADNLAEALDLHADIILRPKLVAEQFELARELAKQQLLSLDDDPRGKVMLKLREQFYPPPLGRSPLGSINELDGLTAEKTAEIAKQRFNLSETIFTVAGKYDFESVCRQMESLFEIEQAELGRQAATGQRAGNYLHEHHDGAQVHIGLMTTTVAASDPDYYNARVIVAVLAGGMSSRLFTEVREKRGLCYAIGARYHGLKEMAGICCYAGTTPEKGQETLDVIKAEFDRLADGISAEEMQRAKVGLKSSLIMQSESSSQRADGIGSDFYLLGRVRSLDEIKQEIEKVSVDSALEFLQNNKFEKFTVVTIGPREISV